MASTPPDAKLMRYFFYAQVSTVLFVPVMQRFVTGRFGKNDKNVADDVFLQYTEDKEMNKYYAFAVRHTTPLRGF